MTHDFSGRVVLVTGGGTGIGLGMAVAFRNCGANVVVTGRRAEPLDAFCKSDMACSHAIRMDVSKPEDIERTIDETIERFGRLDVLINNALAVSGDAIENLRLDQIRTMYDVLLLGPTLMVRAALPHLEASGGNVINISSVASRMVAHPSMMLTVYSAAKAGLSHLSRQLASELGPRGIRVNAIAPGTTRSETGDYTVEQAAAFAKHTPLGRVGEPQDIAKVALFLASEDAGWVTGQDIDVSGGWGNSG